MANIYKIGVYPQDDNITPNDYLIGTDADSANKTKNFRISSLISLIETSDSNGVVSGDIRYSLRSSSHIISNLSYWLGGLFYTLVDDVTVTISPSDSNNPRKDLIYAEANGVIAVKEGFPSANPATPILDSRTQLLIATVFVDTYNNRTNVKGGVVGYLGTGFNYQVSAIELQHEGQVSFIDRTPITLSNGDANNNRFDIFVLNLETKIVSAKPGTPSINPQIPYYDPNIEFLLSTVLIPANATEPVNLNTLVYAENAQIGGGEFNTSTNNIPIVTLDSVTDPDTGTISILHDDPSQNIELNTITFDSTINILSNVISSLFFRVKINQDFDPTTFTVYLLDSNDNVVSNVLRVKDIAVIDVENNSTYQTVGLPFSLFNNISFSKIVIGLRAFNTPLFIDNVQLVYGIPTIPQGNSSYLGLTDTRDTTFLGKEGYIPKVIDGQLEFVPSDSALGSTFQRFFATPDQTDFTITSNPSGLSFVSVQQGIATTDLWTYANGVLSFNEGLIVGTEVLAVWGGINPNANQANETNKTIVLDTSLDSFTGTQIGIQEAVKTYVIPPNTILDGDLITLKMKMNRFTGTANPGISIWGESSNSRLVNLVSELTFFRHVIFKNGTFYKFPTSGGFAEDLDRDFDTINFTSENGDWDGTQINSLKLRLTFEQIAIPEYQLMFLSIERIRQSV